MNLNEVLNCLGQPLNDLETAKVLKSIGVENLESIHVPDGEFSEYFISKSEGFSLIFTDEAMFLGRAHQLIGSGPLYFAGIFLYAGGKDGYSPFSSELPFGIRFSMNREDLVSILGESDWQANNTIGSVGAERWDGKAPYKIHIAYSPEGKPAVITFNIPRANA